MKSSIKQINIKYTLPDDTEDFRIYLSRISVSINFIVDTDPVTHGEEKSAAKILQKLGTILI